MGPLRHAGWRNLGLHNLDIDTIVGSVGRGGDFDRWFRPRRPVNRQRWEALDRASRTGAILPPIEVYKVGHLHFVRDGHHRVSIARAHGMRTIDALVTEVDTTLPAQPLQHLVERAALLSSHEAVSGVATTRWRNAAPRHLPWRGRHLQPARPGVQAARFGWPPAARPG